MDGLMFSILGKKTHYVKLAKRQRNLNLKAFMAPEHEKKTIILKTRYIHKTFKGQSPKYPFNITHNI